MLILTSVIGITFSFIMKGHIHSHFRNKWNLRNASTTEDLNYSSSVIILEKEMAPHSSTLAWRIPGMGEPGGLRSMGSHRESDTTEVT